MNNQAKKIVLPRVDVLLATYNGEKYLEEQVESILNQTFPDFKLIVRDDGSTDGTRDLLKKLARKDSRISLVEGYENVGVNDNFSRLLEASKASYICFADQDDIWGIDKIELSLEKLLAMESIYGQQTPLMVHTDLYVVDEELAPIASSFWKYAHLSPKNAKALNRLLVQNVVTGCTLMMNRSLADLSMPFPQKMIQHDWWLALIACAFGTIGSMEDKTVYYRQHHKNVVGASQYSMQSQLHRVLYDESPNRRIESMKDKSLSQTVVFKERFGSRLNAKQRKIVDAYIHVLQGSFWKSCMIAIRYRFLKHGWMGNLRVFLQRLMQGS